MSMNKNMGDFQLNLFFHLSRHMDSHGNAPTRGILSIRLTRVEHKPRISGAPGTPQFRAKAG